MYREVDKVDAQLGPKLLKAYSPLAIQTWLPESNEPVHAGLHPDGSAIKQWYDWSLGRWVSDGPMVLLISRPPYTPRLIEAYIPILREVTLEYQRSAVIEPDSALLAETLELLNGTSKFRAHQPRKPKYHPPTFRGRAPNVPALLSHASFSPLPTFSRLKPAKRDAKLRRIEARREAIIARVNSSRLLAYNKRQEDFERRYKTFVKSKERYEETYATRLRKYHRRLDLFKAWSERQAKGWLRTVGFRRIAVTENEYTRLRLRSDDSKRGCEAWYWSRNDGLGRRHLYPCGNTSDPDEIGFSQFYSLRAKNISNVVEHELHRWVDAHEAEIGLVERLYEKLADQRVHIGNILAERQQTFDMIVSLWTNITSLVQKKRSLLELSSALLTKKGAADAILQLQFGVKPLVDDVTSLIDVFESGLPLANSRIKTKTSKIVPKLFHGFGHTGSMGSFDGYMRIGYTAILNTDNTPARVLSQLGLVDPLQIAWEVTPWSFVVDWVIPIGDWIMAQTALTGLQSWSVQRSLRALGTFELLEGLTSGEQWTPTTEGTGTLTGPFLGEFKSRKNVPLPAPSGLLEFRNPLSATHGIEAVALILQRFK